MSVVIERRELLQQKEVSRENIMRVEAPTVDDAIRLYERMYEAEVAADARRDEK